MTWPEEQRFSYRMCPLPFHIRLPIAQYSFRYVTAFCPVRPTDVKRFQSNARRTLHRYSE